MWENWVYIAIPLMILVLIGMLIVRKTMQSSPMLQPILFVCVALELGLVISVFYRTLGGAKSGVHRLLLQLVMHAAERTAAFFVKGLVDGNGKDPFRHIHASLSS